MTVELTRVVPQLRQAQVNIAVHITAMFNVTAFSARQKVNRLLVTDVGTGLGSGEPALIIESDRLLWRTPVLLSLPNVGCLGQVGQIDVDAQTGEVLTDAEHLEAIGDHAERLATGSAL